MNPLWVWAALFYFEAILVSDHYAHSLCGVSMRFSGYVCILGYMCIFFKCFACTCNIVNDDHYLRTWYLLTQ